MTQTPKRTSQRDDLIEQILQHAETVIDLMMNHVEDEFEANMTKELQASLGDSVQSLSLKECHVLNEVAKRENANASSMAEKLRLTRGGMSKILARLEKKGFIAITMKQGSRKEHAFSLTSQGEVAVRIHERLHCETEEKWKDLLRTYNATDLQVIERLCADVLRTQCE